MASPSFAWELMDVENMPPRFMMAYGTEEAAVHAYLAVLQTEAERDSSMRFMFTLLRKRGGGLVLLMVPKLDLATGQGCAFLAEAERK